VTIFERGHATRYRDGERVVIAGPPNSRDDSAR
jgi:hypothetical protein